MAEPNDMWQTDYKGHFPLQDGEECHPLNILDDHSRFCLCSEALGNETFESFQPVLLRLFRTYGLPRYFLSDNGNPWGNGQKQGYSTNDVWMMQLGILPIHSRLHHPQTQGKDESFNRSMTRELLKSSTFKDMQAAQAAFQNYRRFYNEKRPHYGIDLATPSSVYRTSPRAYPQEIAEWRYPEGYRIIHVNSSGHFKYHGHEYYLGEAFHGEFIGMR